MGLRQQVNGLISQEKVAKMRIHEPLRLVDWILHHGKVHVEHADLAVGVSVTGKGKKRI